MKPAQKRKVVEKMEKMSLFPPFIPPKEDVEAGSETVALIAAEIGEPERLL